MKTKIIDISEYFDSESSEMPEVTIKRMGFGEQNDIIDQVTKTKIKSRTDVEVTPEYGKMKTLTLLKCIVKAPFPITHEYIQSEMDAVLGDFLFMEIDMFNTLKSDKKKLFEVVGKV